MQTTALRPQRVQIDEAAEFERLAPQSPVPERREVLCAPRHGLWACGHDAEARDMSHVRYAKPRLIAGALPNVLAVFIA